MDTAAPHLLLNHVPVLGAAFAGAIALAGRLLRRGDVEKTGYWLLVVSGLAALPAYFTGEAAEHVVEKLPGVLESAIHAHEEAAEAALAAVLGAAGAALAVLYRSRGRAPSRAEAALILAAALAAAVLLARAAHLGGLVRHTELL